MALADIFKYIIYDAFHVTMRYALCMSNVRQFTFLSKWYYFVIKSYLFSLPFHIGCPLFPHGYIKCVVAQVVFWVVF